MSNPQSDKLNAAARALAVRPDLQLQFSANHEPEALETQDKANLSQAEFR